VYVKRSAFGQAISSFSASLNPVSFASFFPSTPAMKSSVGASTAVATKATFRYAWS
jgi:hypothetical protein